MVLQIAEQAVAGEAAVGRPVAPAASSRVAAPVDVALGQRGGDVVDRTEVGVVTGDLAGQRRVQRMVEVVGPLRVHAETVALPRGHDARVVEVALGDGEQGAAELGGQRGHLAGQLGQQVHSRGVDDGVDSVEPQPVAVVVAQPHLGVVEDEAPHLVRPGVVVVDSGSPRRVVLVGEVGPELRKVVARGSEVVVDDVHDDAETAGVARVDQPLEAVRPAVRLLDGEDGDPVVAPAAVTREGVDRQQLDQVDAQVDEVVEAIDDAVEGALGAERADVQLVDDAAVQRHSSPLRIGPREGAVVDDTTRSVHSAGLPRRARVGHRVAAIEDEGVVAAGGEAGQGHVPPRARPLAHRVPLAAGLDLDRLCRWCPH